MGRIEFIGIVNDFFGKMKIEEGISTPPENAHFINKENWIDIDKNSVPLSIKTKKRDYPVANFQLTGFLLLLIVVVRIILL